MDDIQGVEIDELEEEGRARRQVRRQDSAFIIRAVVFKLR